MFRIGMGIDSHAFVLQGESKPLKLGGIVIPGHLGLLGNSDADVLLHAVFNAISQALGKRSIGYYCDALYQNGIGDSEEYLKLPLQWLEEEGFEISNLGITVECQTPRIEDHSDQIRKRVSCILKIDDSQVGLNATTGEDITLFGKGMGIQASVIVLLESSRC